MKQKVQFLYQGLLEDLRESILKIKVWLSVVVLQPHPQYGGSMNNRIVQLMYNIFLENGFLL